MLLHIIMILMAIVLGIWVITLLINVGFIVFFTWAMNEPKSKKKKKTEKTK